MFSIHRVIRLSTTALGVENWLLHLSLMRLGEDEEACPPPVVHGRAEAEALAIHLENVDVMGQAVEERAGEVIRNLSPISVPSGTSSKALAPA